MADAPLKAGAGLLPKDSQELDLFNQILNVLMHVGETTYRMTGQMRRGRGQISIFLFAGQGIGHSRSPHMRSRSGMARYVLDSFPFVIYSRMNSPQTLYVFSSIPYFHE
jgi:hypothetical protein